MARCLFSQTLIQTTTTTSQSLKQSLSHHHRLFSTQSTKPQLIEVDLEPSDTEVEVLGLRKLEDAIHNIIVRQSAPDWLPFVPGSSYWVPPPRRHHRRDSHGIVNLLRKFHKPVMMDGGEYVTGSGYSSRGWPSSAYFIEGASTMHSVPIEMEAEGVNSNEENLPDVKNEER